jgi:hypothetical protein
VCAPPGFRRRDLLGVFRSGFLGLFGALLGSDFGALLLAAILSELPVLGSQEVLGMLAQKLAQLLVATCAGFTVSPFAGRWQAGKVCGL